MRFRTLPGTDLNVSVVSFGCWAIGGLWWGDDVDDGTSVAAVHEALDLGINLFDTAPLYGHGHADEVLVRALGARKREVVIATKVGVRWDGEGTHASSDLHPDYLRADCEASLRRLDLDRIPLLQVHWPCEHGTPLEDTLGALERLQDEGKIRHFGLCNYNAEGLRAAADSSDRLVSLQTPYSMMRREFEGSLQQTVTAAGPGGGPLGVLAYEPLCRGLLTGKFQAEPRFPESDLRHRDDRFKGLAFRRAQPLIRHLGKIADKAHLPMASLAIAWVARRSGVTSVIAGCKRPEQVRENAYAADLLDADPRLWELLDRVVSIWRG